MAARTSGMGLMFCSGLDLISASAQSMRRIHKDARYAVLLRRLPVPSDAHQLGSVFERVPRSFTLKSFFVIA